MFSTLSAVSVVHNIHITLRSVIYLRYGASLVAQTVQRLLTIQETWVWSLGREDSPGEGKWQLTPVFMPGKSHGPGSLVGYSPWGCKESDMTEWLHFTSLHIGQESIKRLVNSKSDIHRGHTEQYGQQYTRGESTPLEIWGMKLYRVFREIFNPTEYSEKFF